MSDDPGRREPLERSRADAGLVLRGLVVLAVVLAFGLQLVLGLCPVP